MFFQEEILSTKGVLAKVWLAAHMEKKLTKAQLLSTDLKASIIAIRREDQEPISFRISGQLLLGVVRIYSRKAKYLLEDCTDANLKLKMAFRPGAVDLPTDQLFANFGAITLGDSVTEFAITIPEPDFSLQDWEKGTRVISGQTIGRPQDLTMQSESFLDRSSLGIYPGGFDGFEGYNDEPQIRFAYEDMTYGNISYSAVEAGRFGGAAGDITALPGMASGIGMSMGDTFLRGTDTTDLSLSRTGILGGELSTYPSEIHPDLTIISKNANVRKRKSHFDQVLELSQHMLNRQLEDTSDITINDAQTPYAKKQLLSWELETSGLMTFMGMNGPSDVVPELQSMFRQNDINISIMEEARRNESFSSYLPGDVLDVTTRDFNLFSPTISGIGSEQAGSVRDELDFTFFDDQGMGDNMSGIYIPNVGPLELAKSSIKGVELIKNSIEERSMTLGTDIEHTPITFNDIAAKDLSSRTHAVQTFFDLLVMKTKDLVNIEQVRPYGEIKIHGKASLFN